MDFIRRFMEHTPQACLIVVGLACTFITMEVQRMPVANDVSFSVFAPVPYLVEALVVIAVGLISSRYSARRLSDYAVLRGLVGVLAIVSSCAVLLGMEFGESFAFSDRALYRISTGLLLMLWGERLIRLGSWREACLVAAAIVLSGMLMCLFAVMSLFILKCVLFLVPFAAGVTLLAYRGRSCNGDSGISADIRPLPLPAFPLVNARDAAIAAGAVFLPLLCRSPTIATQSAWISLQDGCLMNQVMQFSIGVGIILGGMGVAFIVRFAWNRNFVLALDLFVLPLSLISLYMAQLAGALFVLYFLIVDSACKIVLFYILMTPFLFSRAKEDMCSPMPLYISFSFMVVSQAFFSELHSVLSESHYAVLASIVVILSFSGAALLALILAHRQLSRRESSSSELLLGASAASDALLALHRLDVPGVCSALGDRFALTPREREIFLLLAQNYRAPYIAEKLVVSQSTVKTHMRNLYAKLGVHSQAELLLLVDEEAAK